MWHFCCFMYTTTSLNFLLKSCACWQLFLWLSVAWHLHEQYEGNMFDSLWEGLWFFFSAFSETITKYLVSTWIYQVKIYHNLIHNNFTTSFSPINGYHNPWQTYKAKTKTHFSKMVFMLPPSLINQVLRSASCHAVLLRLSFQIKVNNLWMVILIWWSFIFQKQVTTQRFVIFCLSPPHAQKTCLITRNQELKF